MQINCYWAIWILSREMEKNSQGLHHVPKWMWRNSCEGQRQAKATVADAQAFRVFIDVSWAFTDSRPGQVTQHFQRGSDYYLIAGGSDKGGNEQLKVSWKVRDSLGLLPVLSRDNSTTHSQNDRQHGQDPLPILTFWPCARSVGYTQGLCFWSLCGKFLGT